MFSRIIATGSYLPKKIVKNHDFEKFLDTSDSWIVERSGIKSRRVAGDDQFVSDLGLEASKKALAQGCLSPNDIDLIIVATTTPDMIFPSTACILQKKLGVTECPAFDIQAVCTGFVYALSVADLFIKSGQAKNALVVGTEIYSRILNYSDRGTCVLFGDGAGAVVLSKSEHPGILSSSLHAQGDHMDKLCVPGWLSNGKAEGEPFVKMDGKGVFKFAVKAFEDVSRKVLKEANKKVEDVSWFIPHQANTRIMDATAKKLGLKSEKVVSTVHHHGNTSAASIPLALDEYNRKGKIQTGDGLLLVGVGGGFTWGGVFLNF